MLNCIEDTATTEWRSTVGRNDVFETSPSQFNMAYVCLSLVKVMDDRLCGLVVRVLGYRSGGPGLIPCTTKKKVMSLELGPLSLVSTTEELLDREVAAPV
jgi:hypothetical protein